MLSLKTHAARRNSKRTVAVTVSLPYLAEMTATTWSNIADQITLAADRRGRLALEGSSSPEQQACRRRLSELERPSGWRDRVNAGFPICLSECRCEGAGRFLRYRPPRKLGVSAKPSAFGTPLAGLASLVDVVNKLGSMPGHSRHETMPIQSPVDAALKSMIPRPGMPAITPPEIVTFLPRD